MAPALGPSMLHLYRRHRFYGWCCLLCNTSEQAALTYCADCPGPILMAVPGATLPGTGLMTLTQGDKPMAKTIPAPAPTQDPAPAGAILDYYDPATIAIGTNYRLPGGGDDMSVAELDQVLGIDDAWLESLKATGGNMEPVALLRREPTETDNRTLVVKYGGARRVWGCLRARLRVFGYVAGDEGDPQAEALARLVAQYRENHDRKDTGAAADARAIQGMLELGMTEAAVSKALRLPGGKDTIAAARRVAASEMASKAAARYDLDLMQAAVVGEFADYGDDEAVKALVVTAVKEPGQFDHTAQQLRDNATERAVRRMVVDELEAAGVTIAEGYHWSNDLDGLRTPDDKPITEEDHASCPGHAAFIQRVYGGDQPDTYRAVYFCADPEANGHKRRSYSAGASGRKSRLDLSDAEQAAELAKKRRVREGNKEWRSAKTVRADFLRALAGRAMRPKQRDAANEFIAAYMISNGYELRQAMERGHPYGCELLGIETKTDDEFMGSAERLQALAELTDGMPGGGRMRVALICLLAAIERQMNEATWQSHGDMSWPHAIAHRYSAGLYLRYLQSLGYSLSPIEHHIAFCQGHYQPASLPAADPEPDPEPEPAGDGEAVTTGPDNFTEVDTGTGMPAADGEPSASYAGDDPESQAGA